MSDEQLIRDFKKFLCEYRNALNFDQINFSAEIKKWNKHKLLPCLDLLIWSNIENVHITNKVLGTVLYPQEFDMDPTERVRKTVGPLVHKVMLSFEYRLQLEDRVRYQWQEPEIKKPPISSGKNIK